MAIYRCRVMRRNRPLFICSSAWEIDFDPVDRSLQHALVKFDIHPVAYCLHRLPRSPLGVFKTNDFDDFILIFCSPFQPYAKAS